MVAPSRCWGSRGWATRCGSASGRVSSPRLARTFSPTLIDCAERDVDKTMAAVSHVIEGGRSETSHLLDEHPKGASGCGNRQLQPAERRSHAPPRRSVELQLA